MEKIIIQLWWRVKMIWYYGKAFRIFCWLSLIVILSLIQIVILFLTLVMRNADTHMSILFEDLIKNGVFFFFATALVGSTLFDFIYSRQLFRTDGLTGVIWAIVPSIIILVTIIIYPNIVLDLCAKLELKEPRIIIPRIIIPKELEVDYILLKWSQIGVAILAIFYSFGVKIRG